MTAYTPVSLKEVELVTRVSLKGHILHKFYPQSSLMKYLPDVSVNIEHDDIEPALDSIKLLEGHVSQETSSKEEEGIHTHIAI
jgi:hypothetical protein